MSDRRIAKIRLKQRLQEELTNPEPNLEKIIDIIDHYESNNLLEIEKLKRTKIITQKKIRGALKQTINAHGPITMKLVQSATKRIFGAFLNNNPTPPIPAEKVKKPSIFALIVESAFILAVIILLIKIFLKHT